MSAGGAFRLARAVAFSVVGTGLGASAHVAGGGSVTGRTMLFGLAVAFLAALPVTGRERGMGLILPLLAAVQVAMHALFSTVHLPAPMADMGGHAHSGFVPDPGMPADLGMLADPGMVADLGMLAVHAVAVVLTALWLSRGEAVLWAVLRRLAARYALIVVFDGPVVPRPAHPRPSRAPGVVRSALLEHSVCGRAPPRH